MVTVSVVIPAHNAASFLEAALDSALRQEFRDLEVVVVNDGSTDNTEGVAQQIALRDSRVRLISIANAGVATARNIGVQHARGTWIAFLDADDCWHPGKLDRQLRVLHNDDSLAAVSSYGVYMADDDRVFGVLQMGPTTSASLHELRTRAKPVWLLTPSVVCRRDVLLDLGGFDASFSGAAEDLDLWTRLGEKYGVIALTEHLVRVRISAGSASMTKFRSIQENTLRVRVNAARRAEGLEPLGAEEFQAWLNAQAANTQAHWETTWRSGFHYRQAGHSFLQRRYARGVSSLIRSACASPTYVAVKLRQQVLPYLARGVRAGSITALQQNGTAW